MNEICDSLVFNHGKCVMHGKNSLVELSPDNAIECAVMTLMC